MPLTKTITTTLDMINGVGRLWRRERIWPQLGNLEKCRLRIL